MEQSSGFLHLILADRRGHWLSSWSNLFCYLHTLYGLIFSNLYGLIFSNLYGLISSNPEELLHY